MSLFGDMFHGRQGAQIARSRSAAVRIRIIQGLIAVVLMLTMARLRAGDWPLWRYDAGHTACTPEVLPNPLVLRWKVQLPRPRPCWPWTQYKLQFDLSYSPVIAGNLLFVPSMLQDSVTAYDLGTGHEQWRFYADGPVRFAPAVRGNRLFFTCDDGFLYCLDSGTGKLIWKIAGSPPSMRVLGNGRLISSRPARGGPVVFDDTVYFAAGVWPFMGTFIHAISPAAGQTVWSNTGSGQIYCLQPHGSPAFGGVAPQGVLTATPTMLLVPGGRSVPAAYDRKTGRLRYFRHAASKQLGGWRVMARGPWFVNRGEVFDAESGDHIFSIPVYVLSPAAAIGLGKGGVIDFWALGAVKKTEVVRKDRRGHSRKVTLRSPVLLSRLQPSKKPSRVFLQAGDQLVCTTSDHTVFTVPCPAPAKDGLGGATRAGKPALVAAEWQFKLPAEPWTMLAASKRLVVVTTDGQILCFAGTSAPPGTAPSRKGPKPAETKVGPKEAAAAATILANSDLTGGRVLVLGTRGRGLAEALLAASTQVRGLVLVAPPSPEIRKTRVAWSQRQLYGTRAAVLPGAITSLKLAPYFASLVVVPAPHSTGFGQGAPFVRTLFRVLRPYGGSAWLRLAPAEHKVLEAMVRNAGLQGAEVHSRGAWAQLVRVGPLPGSGTWALQYGNAANTVCSQDRLARPPFGLLWFGGPTNLDVLPRHGHGPPEQVVGGRLFIEGIHLLSARDVYTGAILWQRKLREVNTFDMYYNKTYRPDPFDLSYNQVHIPGANAYGTNFAATPDRVYIVAGDHCRVLDAATGAQVGAYRLPALAGEARPNWGYIGVDGDLLIAGAVPVRSEAKELKFNSRFGRGSRWLVIMDRHSGRVLWKRAATYNFRHNTIAVGNGCVFCIDGMTSDRLKRLERRGLHPDAPPELLALDSHTGQLLWKVGTDVFGTWLGYSAEFDVLLEAGSRSSDRARDEIGTGMTAFRGRTGKPLWKNDARYLGPCILLRDRIITQVRYGTKSAGPGGAYSLLTGKPILRKHPMTGAPVSWNWLRFYGCNTAIAGANVLTFRSAAAAFLDMQTGQGTASLGGFKSGCTSNLVPADGVLNAPDYTRTCTCAYPNQSSLALVHDPDVETWAFDWFPPPAAPTAVRRVGLNLGAPGNHTDTDGTLWLDVPSVGGPSPDIPVWVDPERPNWFRRYSGYVNGQDTWITASGAEGLRTVVIRPFLQPAPVGKKTDRVNAYDRNVATVGPIFSRKTARGAFHKPQAYTVRLFFAEFAGVKAGERVFAIDLQGKRVADKVDVRAMAGGPDRSLVREFRNIPVKQDLVISLSPAASSRRPPLLCGIELTMAP